MSIEQVSAATRFLTRHPMANRLAVTAAVAAAFAVGGGEVVGAVLTGGLAAIPESAADVLIVGGAVVTSQIGAEMKVIARQQENELSRRTREAKTRPETRPENRLEDGLGADRPYGLQRAADQSDGVDDVRGAGGRVDKDNDGLGSTRPGTPGEADFDPWL